MQVEESTNKKPAVSKFEKGSSIFEFAAALPLFLMLMGMIGISAWVFWAQAAADIVLVRAIREGSFNRGADVVNVPAASGYYAENLPFIVGGQSASVVGSPQANHVSLFHMVTLQLQGGVDLSFGIIDNAYEFGGGAAGRYWIFYPGPPDPWE